jgi:hypothetical protein
MNKNIWARSVSFTLFAAAVLTAGRGLYLLGDRVVIPWLNAPKPEPVVSVYARDLIAAMDRAEEWKLTHEHRIFRKNVVGFQVLPANRGAGFPSYGHTYVYLNDFELKWFSSDDYKAIDTAVARLLTRLVQHHSSMQLQEFREALESPVQKALREAAKDAANAVVVPVYDRNQFYHMFDAPEKLANSK